MSGETFKARIRMLYYGLRKAAHFLFADLFAFTVLCLIILFF